MGWGMIKRIPHPTHEGLSAYVIPFERDGVRSVFWLGTDLTGYEKIAAGMGKPLEEYLAGLLSYYFPGSKVCDR